MIADNPITATQIVVTLVFAYALWGYFKSKKEGFGPYNTSSLLLILSLYVGAIVALTPGMKTDYVPQMIFALIGFAAGLFTASATKRDDA